MKWLIAVVIALALPTALTFTAQALAANGNLLTWDAPTTREDGAAFNMATEGLHYKVTWSKGGETEVVTVPPTVLQLDVTSYESGTTFTIAACDKASLCSVASNSVKKTGKPSKPTGVGLE